MKNRKTFTAITIIFLLSAMLSITSTQAATSTNRVIASTGNIIRETQFLALNSLTNPVKVDEKILISGQLNLLKNSNYANTTVNIQISKDQKTWLQISTVRPNGEGTFETEYTFTVGGNYIIKATCENLEATYSQLVVDVTVSQNNTGDISNIQAVIDSAPPNGIVYIQSGTYELQGKMLTLKNNVSLIGAGIDQTLIKLYPTNQINSSGYVLYSNQVTNNLWLENFTIVQNAYGYATHCSPGGIGLEGPQNINVSIRNIKVTDVSGEAIFVRNYNNLLIEKCIIERAWTGIAPQIGLNAVIRNNSIKDTTGDGIFPQLQANNITIQDNYLQNIGDTAIDITGSILWGTPSEINVIVSNNTIINGPIRVTNAKDVQIIGNKIQNGQIVIDGGKGTPYNVNVYGNWIVSTGTVGIGFRGAVNSSAENNLIEMKAPTDVNITQSGITAAIWTRGLIKNNIIRNSANYGIDFAGWGLGSGQNITISDNIIQNFGTFGIYDNEKGISMVYIKNNTFEYDNSIATAIKECPANHWTVLDNSFINTTAA